MTEDKDLNGADHKQQQTATVIDTSSKTGGKASRQKKKEKTK